MSNILKSKNDLDLLKDIINYLNANDISKFYLDEILKFFIPKDNNNFLINYNIKERGFITAAFIPKMENITMSVNKIYKWLNENTYYLTETFNVKDEKILRSYLFLFLITHEIEHSYQYLMAKGKIEVPYNFISKGYSGLFEILNPKESIMPRPIKDIRRMIALVLYNVKENSYVLERNANVESTDLLCRCALNMNREDMYKVFNKLKNDFMKFGYTNDTIGSFQETYKKILMYDKYKKIFNNVDVSEEERIRYGLEILEDTREKVLSL